MSKQTLFRLPDGTIAYLEKNPLGQILKDKGLAENGNVQMYFTQNVLRRIIKYMAMRSGMTIKVTVAQTDIKKPEIVTNTPYAGVLFYGKRNGKPIHYTTTYNKNAGPRPDLRLSAEEGAAMAADLQRYINKRGKG